VECEAADLRPHGVARVRRRGGLGREGSLGCAAELPCNMNRLHQPPLVRIKRRTLRRSTKSICMEAMGREKGSRWGLA
jgi:hypothetical protein